MLIGHYRSYGASCSEYEGACRNQADGSSNLFSPCRTELERRIGVTAEAPTRPNRRTSLSFFAPPPPRPPLDRTSPSQPVVVGPYTSRHLTSTEARSRVATWQQASKASPWEGGHPIRQRGDSWDVTCSRRERSFDEAYRNLSGPGPGEANSAIALHTVQYLHTTAYILVQAPAGYCMYCAYIHTYVHICITYIPRCQWRMDVIQPSGRRQRRPHTRSKNGCSTCKKRRVRCGEERPIWYVPHTVSPLLAAAYPTRFLLPFPSPGPFSD